MLLAAMCPGAQLIESSNSYDVLFGNNDLKQLEDSACL